MAGWLDSERLRGFCDTWTDGQTDRQTYILTVHILKFNNVHTKLYLVGYNGQ